MNTTKLSETEFVESCSELFMHLYNWELGAFDDCDKSEYVTVPPSVEKTRAKLDKYFDPNSKYNSYTEFFTQEQLESTGVSWIPYACYLANESSFTQVIAEGSWSSDPFHECGDLDIQKIRQDFSDPVAQFILGNKIAIINPTYKTPYDTIKCEFENFITTLDSAIQIYKLMTHLDKYNQASSYVELYGKEFMDELDSKLEFDSYRNIRAKNEEERAKERATYEQEMAVQKAKKEEEIAKKEAERKAEGILSLNEINEETDKISTELHKLFNETFKIKTIFAECKAKIYEDAFEKGMSKEDINPLLNALKEKLKTEFLNIKSKTDELTQRHEKFSLMKTNSINNLTSSLTKLNESLKAFTDKSNYNSMEDLYAKM